MISIMFVYKSFQFIFLYLEHVLVLLYVHMISSAQTVVRAHTQLYSVPMENLIVLDRD